MSFILDALKKSELDRQRQAMPGLIDVPVATRKRRLPLWALLLGGLLLVNIGVITVLLLRGIGAKSVAANAPTPRVTATPGVAPAAPLTAKAVEPAAETTAATPVSDHFSPLDRTPVYAPEIPVNDTPPPTTRKASPAQGGASEGTSTAAGSISRTPRRSEPTLNDADGQDDHEVLPSINELNLTGAQALPEMHLDVHVYATHAPDRFVYINMRKYHEGSTLQEGPTLERIRRDGVVLSYHGLRFLLPRQGS
jgi:general secretion pathway protein B